MMNRNRKNAFTLVELLTTLGIVLILIALLLPALKKVKALSFDVRERGQLGAIEVAIEVYRNDFAAYPPSGYYPDAGSDIPRDSDGIAYYGCEKLAEALLGYDLLGVHQNVRTNFSKEGKDSAGNSLYTAADGTAKNLDLRKGPYIETDKMLPVESGTSKDIFNVENGGHYISDVYKRDNLTYGMPVLYYRAKPDNRVQNAALTIDKVYDYRDNNLPYATNTASDIEASYIQGRARIWNTIDNSKTAERNFDDFITNQQISVSGSKIPYRAQSYLLITAGADGIYGSNDDICNFDRN